LTEAVKLFEKEWLYAFKENYSLSRRW
jgi:hypothetical protein